VEQHLVRKDLSEDPWILLREERKGDSLILLDSLPLDVKEGISEKTNMGAQFRPRRSAVRRIPFVLRTCGRFIIKNDQTVVSKFLRAVMIVVFARLIERLNQTHVITAKHTQGFYLATVL
jgi:hypothetical protein